MALPPFSELLKGLSEASHLPAQLTNDSHETISFIEPMLVDESARDSAQCQWAFCTKEFPSVDELLPHVSTSHLSANRCLSKKRSPHISSAQLPSAIISPARSLHSACTHPFDYKSYDIRNLNDLASAPNIAFVHACKWALCTLSNFTSVDELFNHLRTDHLTFSVSSNDLLAVTDTSLTSSLPLHSVLSDSLALSASQDPLLTIDDNDTDIDAELFSFSLRRTLVDPTRSRGSAGNGQASSNNDLFVDINPAFERTSDYLYEMDASRPAQRRRMDELSDESIQKVSMDEYIAGPHGCLWNGCQDRFDSFDKLTVHVSEYHIGSGKSEYICKWRHCGRDGKPFPQRQKVMRHIQTRTCPEPACGQDFAIPGALTIHIRKHTGEKPFKCKMDGSEFTLVSVLFSVLSVASALLVQIKLHDTGKHTKILN
ncbi:zinc-finger protein [Nowakowskiella sp. JEL0078]|nr:zinc-finger protein [Nowakowskiella sp. JEL0078]